MRGKGSAAQLRIRRAEDFRKIRRDGIRVNAPAFIFNLLIKDADGGQRLAVIASKKVGNAVVRNRAKRLFRELFRKNRMQLPACSDLVIVVRSNFDDFSFDQLHEQFLKAAAQCKHAR